MLDVESSTNLVVEAEEASSLLANESLCISSYAFLELLRQQCVSDSDLLLATER